VSLAGRSAAAPLANRSTVAVSSIDLALFDRVIST